MGAVLFIVLCIVISAWFSGVVFESDVGVSFFILIFSFLFILMLVGLWDGDVRYNSNDCHVEKVDVIDYAFVEGQTVLQTKHIVFCEEKR